MNLKLEIRRNADGVVTSQVWKNWNFNAYWWQEGNASCDCNREDFFLDAQGVDTDDRESQCGKGRYSVRCTDADSGQVLYDEFKAPDTHKA
jgi:hypothetical protein